MNSNILERERSNQDLEAKEKKEQWVSYSYKELKEKGIKICPGFIQELIDKDRCLDIDMGI